jgi:hypothetical protein
MILLAYLFLLQALLALGAALAARSHAPDPGMVLCASAMADGAEAAGTVPTDGSRAPCCDLGCLPHAAGFAAPALAASSSAPARTPGVAAAGSAWPVREAADPPRPWRPNSAGPRAPPLPVA